MPLDPNLEQRLSQSLNVLQFHRETPDAPDAPDASKASGLAATNSRDAPTAAHAPFNPPNVAVVGCGRWGKNLIRNFESLGALAAVVDAQPENIRAAYDLSERVLTAQAGFPSLDALLASDIGKTLSGVAIATPTQTHFKLAHQALEAGLNVYVEKPMATTTEDVQTLQKLAQLQNKQLMVGHLLLYHPAVRRLRQLIVDEQALGPVLHIESTRLNTNAFRPDESVIWDLAPHDLSMMAYVLNATPAALTHVRVERTQANLPQGDTKPDIAWLDVAFQTANGQRINGHAHVSWAHPKKHVQLVVRGEHRTAVLDDTQIEGKLQVFNNAKPHQPDWQEAIEYLAIEPLRLECQHYLNVMSHASKIQPLTGADHALPIVAILQEAHARI
ncbi:MAG: Gfo/Idh/MocA family oxidoreductase [Vampirovibrionales bacterium]|nr:Gfo/Idh/MocA family oxidoreductase [Vampirovibrionales bacterium]